MLRHQLLLLFVLAAPAFADEPASELLTTVEAVESHVENLIEQRELMTNYAIEVVSQSTRSNGRIALEASRIWVHGDDLREDRASRETIEIFTPKHNIRYDEGKWSYRADDGRRGWTEVPDYSRFGISDHVHRNEESHGDYLLPKNRKNIQIEIGEHENQKVTIVRYDRDVNEVNAWTEYRLSPKYANNPVFLQQGWANKDKEGVDVSKTLVSLSINWKNYDGVWFPERVTSVRREPGREPQRQTYRVKRARFNLQPFPDVFSPEATMLKFRQTTEEVEGR